MLNKTSISNLKYIAIMIGIIMLLPLLNRREFARGRRRRRRNKEREATVMYGTGVNESAASKARRKAKKCKYLSSPRARKNAGC